MPDYESLARAARLTDDDLVSRLRTAGDELTREEADELVARLPRLGPRLIAMLEEEALWQEAAGFGTTLANAMRILAAGRAEGAMDPLIRALRRAELEEAEPVKAVGPLMLANWGSAGAERLLRELERKMSVEERDGLFDACIQPASGSESLTRMLVAQIAAAAAREWRDEEELPMLAWILNDVRHRWGSVVEDYVARLPAKAATSLRREWEEQREAGDDEPPPGPEDLLRHFDADRIELRRRARAEFESWSPYDDPFADDEPDDPDYAPPFLRVEPKVGRNDPCPCGSGKKFKKCCERAKAPTETRAPWMDRRGMEQASRDIGRILAQGKFDSVEDLNRAIAGKSFEEIRRLAGPEETPLEKAQSLMHQAFEAKGPRRAELAERALATCADCADAWVLLAEETSTSEADALRMFANGVAAGTRALGGEAALNDPEGHFWSRLETRPYMRARRGVAGVLELLGRPAEAAAHLRDLLRLNPQDNQGNRYALLRILMTSGPAGDIDSLLRQFPDDVMAHWTYLAALHRFRTAGDSPEASAALENARRWNRHAPAFLLGLRPLPAASAEYVEPGKESEAAACAQETRPVWVETPGALAWLERECRKPAAER